MCAIPEWSCATSWKTRSSPARTGKKRDYHQPFDALRRLTQVFAERPHDVLQELVNVAVSCCGADSAGISLAEPNEAGEQTFRWIAIAGSFKPYLGGRTPRFFSPWEPASTVAVPNCTESRNPITTSWVSLPIDLGRHADPLGGRVFVERYGPSLTVLNGRSNHKITNCSAVSRLRCHHSAATGR